VEAAAIFLDQGRSALPVVDGNGVLAGVLTVRDVERAAAGEGPVKVSALTEEAPVLHLDEPLAVAVDWLAGGEREGMPIMAADGCSVIGWIDHRDVLRVYASRTAGSSAGPPAPRTQLDTDMPRISSSQYPRKDQLPKMSDESD
jgi:CBS domain-containing protein